MGRPGDRSMLFPGVAYECGSVDLGDSDVLVVYSDGITEAAGLDDEEFGSDRLTEVVKGCRDKSIREIREAILRAVEQWAGTELQDDMTLVVVKVDEGKLEDSGS